MNHVCHQEQRISKIESDITGQNRDIQNLINRLDKLTNGIWALVLVTIPIILSMFGFLLWQVLGRGG